MRIFFCHGVLAKLVCTAVAARVYVIDIDAPYSLDSLYADIMPIHVADDTRILCIIWLLIKWSYQ